MTENVYLLFDSDYPSDFISAHKTLDGALQAAGELLDDGQECYLEDHPNLPRVKHVMVGTIQMFHINEVELRP